MRPGSLFVSVSRSSSLTAAAVCFLLLGAATGQARAAGIAFAAMCDSRGDHEGVSPNLSPLAEHLATVNPQAKFLFFPGDMIAGSERPGVSRREYAQWKKVMAPVYDSPNMLWPKVWPAPGNHEIQRPDDEDAYREAFPDVFMNGPRDEKGLTYSFDSGDSHFAVLDTVRWGYGDPGDPEDDGRDWHHVKNLDWLEKDLASARARGVRHIFVFGHDPAFPISGGHLADGLPNIGSADNPDRTFLHKRDAFWKILSEHRVAAYICGHEHLYGRQSIDGVYQIVAGGAGAPLHTLNPCRGKNSSPHATRVGPDYEGAAPYYEILGYPHGPDDNCQASPDFVGGRFFSYVVMEAGEESVSVKTWGVEPKKGSATEIAEVGALRIVDEFTIRD
ncbi:MAG: metallophosphoesterase [Elusimicrobiota bacterium]